MKNLYTKKYAKKLDFASQLKTKEEKENLIADIINKIYSDGFEDGYNEKENENIQMLERENKKKLSQLESEIKQEEEDAKENDGVMGCCDKSFSEGYIRGLEVGLSYFKK